MKSNPNMLEALKKLFEKPACKPATMATIDRRLDGDDDPGGCRLQQSEIDSKEEEIEEMLQKSEEVKGDIKNINETLGTLMSVKAKDVPSLVDEPFNKRLENVGNKIIEIKGECEKTFEDCKASLCTQWDRTKARMTVERENQQPVSKKRQEDTFSSEADIGPAEKFYKQACQVRRKEEDRLEQLDQDGGSIAQDLDDGKKFQAMYKTFKALVR